MQKWVTAMTNLSPNCKTRIDILPVKSVAYFACTKLASLKNYQIVMKHLQSTCKYKSDPTMNQKSFRDNTSQKILAPILLHCENVTSDRQKPM